MVKDRGLWKQNPTIQILTLLGVTMSQTLLPSVNEGKSISFRGFL